MSAAGAGPSVYRDPVEAALEAGLAAHARSGADHAGLCLVFSTCTAHTCTGGLVVYPETGPDAAPGRRPARGGPATP